MARTKANHLVGDSRRITDRLMAAQKALAAVTMQHDDADLAMAEGKLADAILFLGGAANKFERRGTDYASRMGDQS